MSTNINVGKKHFKTIMAIVIIFAIFIPIFMITKKYGQKPLYKDFNKIANYYNKEDGMSHKNELKISRKEQTRVYHASTELFQKVFNYMDQKMKDKGLSTKDTYCIDELDYDFFSPLKTKLIEKRNSTNKQKSKNEITAIIEQMNDLQGFVANVNGLHMVPFWEPPEWGFCFKKVGDFQYVRKKQNTNLNNIYFVAFDKKNNKYKGYYVLCKENNNNNSGELNDLNECLIRELGEGHAFEEGKIKQNKYGEKDVVLFQYIIKK